MFEISVSEKIKNACPDFRGAAIFAEVENTEFSKELWDDIERFSAEYRSRYTTDSIKDMVAINATRKAYKTLGKDPSRYRPASEALCRRILKGMELYRIDTLVDLINLVSIASGYSIGGFDADRIEGETLVLGVGEKDELYEGIGRGMLNIENLPVYRDAVGGIGTPTSDNERTKITFGTTHLLTIINSYSGEDGLADAAGMMSDLLEKYAAARNVEIKYFR